ncbi:SusC/RagA family TonB-linked outer membrane protein [Flavobacterium magnum]|uniref:SusC/RagA family TonB-linked outer membrane protein n=1 Tax=Flavobacterium magnum TaxID=2162713 RepID=A0A2S0RAY5_9FLAO|nr:SusC/RagA family TonB-linked outer membrane protein [Flavobacterium magnum]AWA28714.1 SusC/RagA family TonB-linked outer membrane protein [Flavobacterium magnum]
MKPRLTNYFAVLFVLFVQFAFAQERTVSGTVSDNSGLPLPGVSIVVKGTQTGTQTDFDGKFSIQATPTTVLVFSFIGMKTQEVTASSTNLNVKMAEDAVELEGVVVTAFGIKRNPKDLGYSVSSVKAEDLTGNSEPDLIRSLNGKVAGVNVNVSTGVAGAANQITIRGINSFNGDTQPLIIVDGVAYDNTEITTSSQVTGGGGYQNGLSSLDPNDIATFNVLKSAAASALYGSRARNGVIVITTKSGSGGKKDSKLSVNVGTGTYFETIANLPDYQNKYGAGANGNYSNSNGSWGPSFESLTTIPTWGPLLDAFPELGPTQPYVAHPNNVKDLFQTGTVIDNTIGFSYSGQDGSFNVTISDLDQDGYIPYNTYDRTSIAVGGTFKLANKLTVGANASLSKTAQVGGFFGENQFDGSSSSFARTLYLARNWDFNLPYKDPVTGYSVTPVAGQFDHPLWSWEHDQISTDTYRTVTGMNLNYAINDHISASYRIGVNRYNLARKEIRDLGSRAEGGLGSITTDNYTNQNIESTLLLNFNYKLSDSFNFEGILGNNIFDETVHRIVYYGKELNLPNIYTMHNVKNISNLLDESTRKRNAGIFADVTFSYKEYLFLNATARNDFSSSLPKDNNSYFYPSASASIILTDALGIKSDVLGFAKLRAAYAKVGNDADAEFIKRSFVQGQAYNGATIIRNDTEIGDPNVTPEFTDEFEIGTDLEFFKRRIIVDLSLYNKTTKDLLTPVTVPTSSGYEILRTNLGEMTNKGIELGLTLVPVQNTNFKWTLYTTFTKNKNEVTELIEGLDRFALDPNEPSYVIKGEPFGVFYGTKFARDANGNYLIDQDGGGIIADPTPGIIGDPNPDFKMSFTNTLSYKGFTLRGQFDYRKGGDISSTTIESLLGRGVTRDTEDREHTFIIPGFYGNSDGTPVLDGAGNQIPNTTQINMNELYFSPAGGNTFAINSVDEADIYDGTVFRLREVSLTYDVPKKFLEKTPFGGISFSVIGNNLWYFAPNVPKYTNFDPDTTSFGGTALQGVEITAAPTAKRYGFRLNLTF